MISKNKKHFYQKLILLLALFSITACRNNDDDKAASIGDLSILGKWYIDKGQIYTSSNQETETSFSSECEKKSTHEFKQTVVTSISYGLSNNICIPTDTVTKNYTFDKPNMKFWYEGEQNYPYFITQLTKTEMVVEDRTQDLDGDNIKDIIRRFFKRAE